MGNKIKQKYFCIGGKHQNFNVNLNRIMPYSAVALVGIFGLILFPVSFAMDSTEAAPVQSTTTLTLATSDLSAEITPNSATGTFVASDPATVSATTNNYSGYTLGITSSDNVNNTKLTNTSDNTAYLTSISSVSAPADFNVGNWGYLPSKLNGAANSTYQPAPTTTATTLDATNTANAEANTYTITLGAKADYSLPSGTYENSFTLTAVANPVAYTITYNKNTEDTVTNMPENQSGSIEDTDITIPNTTPTREHYTFQGWCDVTPTTDNGIDSCSGTTYQPGDVISMNKTAANNITLYAMWRSNIPPCDATKLCVQYNGNGLTFDGEPVNRVNYNSTTSQTPTTKYAHTPNINDAGVASGTYPTGSKSFREIISIPGATSLTVTLSYSIEENYDYLYVFTGEYEGAITGSENTPMSAGQDYTFTGGNSTTSGSNSTTFTISGDTLTFAFWSDPGTAYYGYYATITGYGYERIVNSGEYTIPTGTNIQFNGWSTSQTTSGSGLPSDVEYINEAVIKNNMPGNNGEIKTLYAVWQQGRAITFNKDSNVSSIAIQDSDGTTVGTITTSGQSLTLYQGNTYTIEPSYAAGYDTNAITKISGAGTITRKHLGAEFTVGDSAATISVDSKIKTYIQNVTTSTCPTTTTIVWDNRDETPYHIQKLADGKCWMLDSLALDLTNSTVKNNLTASNTNASATTLNYLKNGGGTTSNQYATAGVANWTSDYSYSAPLVNMASKDVVPDNAPTNGAGYNKVGGYYNYCAASAGSYCYGDGTSAGTSSGNATEDICPKNWRMPTSNTGEYGALANAIYGSTSSTSDATKTANFRNALSLPLSGGFYGGSVYSQGSSGYFWSSTRSGNSSMYYLNVGISNVNPSYDYGRYSGLPVRCLAGV